MNFIAVRGVCLNCSAAIDRAKPGYKEKSRRTNAEYRSREGAKESAHRAKRRWYYDEGGQEREQERYSDWYYRRGGKETKLEHARQPGNRSIRNAYTAKRRAKKLMATPPWADLERIQQIYQNCPPGHEVDHIVPLQGKNVSGLHVAWNLQYLPASENKSKGNRFNG